MAIKIKGISLRIKLIIAMSAVALIPFLLANLIALGTAEKTIKKIVVERNMCLAKSMASDIDHMFSEKKRIMEIAVENSDIRSMDPARLVPALRSLTDHQSDLVGAIVLAPNADLVARWDGKEIKANYSDREYFHTAAKTGVNTISDVLISKTTGQLDIGIAEPIRNPDRTLGGMLVIGVSLKKIIDRIAHTKINESGYAFVVNKNGKVLMHSDSSLMEKGAALSGMDSVRAAISGRTGWMEHVYQGSRYLISYSYVAATRWGLVVQQPMDDAMSAVSALKNTNITIMIFAVLVAILFVFPLARIIFKPISQLTDKAEIIAGGDLTAKVNFESSDELGKLAVAFNKMTTQLRARQDALQQSREKYRQIVETSNEGIIVLDSDRQISFVNTRMSKMLGYGTEEMIGKKMELFLFDQDYQDHRTRMQERRQGKADQYERRWRHHDGQEVWTIVSATPIFDAMHHVEGSFGMVADITELKRAIDAIRESENRYRLIMESSPDPIVTYDMQGNAMYINPAFSRVFGWTPEEFLGRKIDYVLEEDMADTQTMLDKLNCGESFFGFQTRCYDKNRNIIDIEMSFGTWKTNSGVPCGSVVILRDVTERKKTEKMLEESESLYRLILSNVHDTVVLTDRQGDFTFVCPNVHFITGYSEKELMELGNINALIGNLHIDNNTLNRKGSLRNIETEILSKSGTRHNVLMGIKTINFKNSSCLYTIHDITEIKEMQNRLIRAQKLETIGNLAGGIAHDFNNILSPIIGMAELLLADLPEDSMEHENTRAILKAGLRGRELVKQILSLSRNTEKRKIPVQIQKILKEVLRLCRSTIPSDIEILQDIQNDCGLVMADATQLHQIAMNLITNAYHAVERKGGKISVLLREIHHTGPEKGREFLSPGPYVILTVSDTGCGIEPEIMDKIFEPYFTTKEPGKGTGLGLATVYVIIKDHNGDIKVESTIGKGTIFNVYLPLMDQSFVPDLPAQVQIPATGKERILLVDDEIPIAKMLKQLLERLGYHVTERFGSMDALEAFQANPHACDLVIADMAMPGMTGVQLAKQLIAIRPDIPVIICTGSIERIDKEKAKSYGVKGFLAKPVIWTQMAELIRKVLDGDIKNEIKT